jgi:uncharacterized membrane protein
VDIFVLLMGISVLIDYLSKGTKNPKRFMGIFVPLLGISVFFNGNSCTFHRKTSSSRVSSRGIFVLLKLQIAEKSYFISFFCNTR